MRYTLLVTSLFVLLQGHSQVDTNFFYKAFPVEDRATADSYQLLNFKSPDSLEAFVTSFNMDHSIKSRVFYKNYLKRTIHGKAMYWNESQRLEKIMSYLNDTLHGESQIMDSLGRIDVKLIYNKGEFYYWEKRQVDGTYKQFSEPYSTLPVFPGCESLENEKDRSECSFMAMYTMLQQNVKFPAVSRDNGISGTVYVGFTINEEGILDEMGVLKMVGGDKYLADEALRAVRTFPKFKAGTEGRVPVKTFIQIPAKFKIRTYIGGRFETVEFENYVSSSTVDFLPSKNILGAKNKENQKVDQIPILKICQAKSTIDAQESCTIWRLKEYLKQEVKVSDTLSKNNKNKIVVINFTISKSGKMKDVKVIQTIKDRSDLTSRALNVVKNIPEFKPAEYKGKSVEFQFTVEVSLN